MELNLLVAALAVATLVTATLLAERSRRAREQAELASQLAEVNRSLARSNRLLTLAAAAGAALTRRQTLEAQLDGVVAAVRAHFDGTFASIWVLDSTGTMLDLVAAGERPEIGRPRTRLAVGEAWVGQVALTRRPSLVDVRAQGPGDSSWASRGGASTFIGHPLMVNDRLVGVIAAWASTPPEPVALEALGSIADGLAITIEREQGREALRLSEARQRSLLESSLAGVVTTDIRGRIESVNPAAERLFGRPAAALIGLLLTDLVSLPDEEAAEPLLTRLRTQALGRVSEWQGRRGSARFPLEMSLFEFESSEGPRLGALMQDVSDRHEVERLKSEFIATVSHELRTPLTAIRGSLGLISTGAFGPLPAEVREMVVLAERNAARLAGVVNDILDVERLARGTLRLDLRPVRARDVVQAAVDTVQTLATQGGVALRLETLAGTVLADEARLGQVLVNLLTNAVKFSPAGTTVSVAAVEGRGEVTFTVRDQGRGIPRDHLPAIFDRFRQVQASDARAGAGVGLGLAIAKGIVEQHGGAIAVESDEGHGSTFTFRIPVARAAATPAAG